MRWQPSGHRRIVAEAWLFVPEGHRRKLAGGKPAPADAAPGCHTQRAMPRRGIGEVFGVGRRAVSATARRLRQVGPPMIGQHPGPFLRCPAGARSHSARFPGAASAGADLPPANLLRRPSGTGTGRPRTDKGKPPAQACCSQLTRLRLRHSSVLQLSKFLACREDLTVAGTARPYFFIFHSLAPNSPAKIGRAPERLRPAPPIKSRVFLRVCSPTPGAARWQVPPPPSPFTRCDRGPVSLRFGCRCAALRSSYLCGPSAPAQRNRYAKVSWAVPPSPPLASSVPSSAAAATE